MLSKRVIACLDVRDGKLAKSVKFVDTKDIGDPVEKAKQYYADGLDELVFYDITASSEKRDIMLDVVEHVAAQIFIPFSVGGGVRSVEDATRLRLAGAEKVNVNTAAVEDPALIARCSEAIGAQSTVLSMDVLRVNPSSTIPSGYEIVIHGGRTHTGRDALVWARKAERMGAGEIVVNSIDADGTREGYEIKLTRMIADAVRVPVIASGGVGTLDHLVDGVRDGHASAVLAASIFHFGEFTIRQAKDHMARAGLPMRLDP